MITRELPFSDDVITGLAEQFPTPFHLYDAASIQATAERLNQTFGWVPKINDIGYINHFAVKATPNPHILQFLAGLGMGADASSKPELTLAQAVGLEYPYTMFTSNNTDPEEYAAAYNTGAILNLDDITEIDKVIARLGGLPKLLSFRYNPGNARSQGVNAIIGTPEDSKFGVSDDQLVLAYKIAKDNGVERFGLHTMVVSNELDAEQHIATARMVFEKVVTLSQKLGIQFDFANLGGGLGVPYKPDQAPIDYDELGQGIKQAYDEIIIGNGLPPLRVVTENGRHVTGPHGFLVTRAISRKDMFGHRYAGVDASMANLARPGMYDAYHHITVVGRELGSRAVQRVVGGLCENNDFFTGAETKDRDLPVIEIGDLLVIHDTGAHGHAMGSNYNGKLRSAEVLYLPDGSAKEIRRAETEADYFATLNYPGLPSRT